MLTRLKLLRLKRKMMEERSGEKSSSPTRSHSGRSIASGRDRNSGRSLRTKPVKTKSDSRIMFIPPNKQLLLTKVEVASKDQGWVA